MTWPTPNDGGRPSRFLLDRYAAGELSPDEAARLEACLDADARAHLAGIEAARSAIPPFDADALRARATSRPARPPRGPAPARPRWTLWLPVLAAALVLLALAPNALRRPDPAPSAGVRIRGEGALLVYTLDGDLLHPYDGRPLGEGDVLGFRVHPGGHAGVVVVSVDGAGKAVVLYPEGDAPMEPLPDGTTVALPGTIVLDDAPGPEQILAVFGRPVGEALDEAATRWERGGAEALAAWAEEAAEVDLVVVPRR